MEPLGFRDDGETAKLELRCPTCERVVQRAETTLCAVCKRRVCLGCVRPYGHHMQACDECRVGEW